ncbi:hypothetical protein BD410DRAFT_807858 [Rickenella mellea]|uniref:Uncharacterized protein n=1 Tax=Rickenella mellea TaxID=50990 RepID=A0A4Y7PNF1_9AGAM|nr:hypothetical protein BD410DRAFT_807858 [Rickenella mellea]
MSRAPRMTTRRLQEHRRRPRSQARHQLNHHLRPINSPISAISTLERLFKHPEQTSTERHELCWGLIRTRASYARFWWVPPPSHFRTPKRISTANDLELRRRSLTLDTSQCQNTTMQSLKSHRSEDEEIDEGVGQFRCSAMYLPRSGASGQAADVHHRSSTPAATTHLTSASCHHQCLALHSASGNTEDTLDDIAEPSTTTRPQQCEDERMHRGDGVSDDDVAALVQYQNADVPEDILTTAQPTITRSRSRNPSFSYTRPSGWWTTRDSNRPWTDHYPPQRKYTVPPEQEDRWQHTRQRVSIALRSVLGDTLDITHELLSIGADTLKYAPIPGLQEVAHILLTIRDYLQLVEVLQTNRLACLRLTERCAEILSPGRARGRRRRGIPRSRPIAARFGAPPLPAPPGPRAESRADRAGSRAPAAAPTSPPLL